MQLLERRSFRQRGLRAVDRLARGAPCGYTTVLPCNCTDRSREVDLLCLGEQPRHLRARLALQRPACLQAAVDVFLQRERLRDRLLVARRRGHEPGAKSHSEYSWRAARQARKGRVHDAQQPAASSSASAMSARSARESIGMSRPMMRSLPLRT